MKSEVLQSYHVDAVDEIDNAEPRAIIRMHCLAAETNEPVVVTVRGIKPWCFVELPQWFYPYGNKSARKKWSDADVHELVSAMRTKLMRDGTPAGIVGFSLVNKSKYYYYQPVERAFQMIKLVFDSIDEMTYVSNRIESFARIPPQGSKQRGCVYSDRFGCMVLRCWEADVSLTRKFMTSTNLTYGGWFRVIPSRIVPLSDSESVYTSREIVVGPAPSDWINAFSPLSQEESTKIPPSAPGVLAYDIETRTDNYRALPDAGNEEHCITMISCVYQRCRQPETLKRILITLKRASISTDKEHPAYKTTNTTVDEFIVCDTEADMLNAFASLIKRLNPDVLTGFNIHIYDNLYLDRRFRKMVNVNGLWPREMGRSKIDDVSLYLVKMRSAGRGIVENFMFTTEGRISVDVMTLVKNDYKLTKYSLDTVSRHFLGEDVGKHDVTARDMFVAYDAAVSTFEQVEAGVIDVVSPQRLSAISNMTKVAAYAIQDSVLVMQLFERLNIWLGLTELSSVAGVTIKDSFCRGQQIRVGSLLYDIASRQDVVIDKRRLPAAPKPKGPDGLPVIDKSADDDSIIKFTGGYVGEPEIGMHENALCVDFSSLYPSVMQAYNISPDTICVATSPLEGVAFSGKTGAYDAKYKNVIAADTNRQSDSRYDTSKVPSDSLHVIELCENGDGEGDEEASDDGEVDADDDDADEDANGGGDGKADTKERRYTFHFVKSSVKVGLLPTLARTLVEKRNEVRKRIGELKKIGAKLEVEVLNQRQLAYKVVANSVYGFIAAQRGGMLSLVEGAMSITAKGRESIKRVNEYITTNYEGSRIVAGDTDSAFFVMPKQITHPSQCHEWGNRLAEELSRLFPPPMKLEFEKAVRLLTLRKKFYAALYIRKDGSYDPKPLVRGIVLARRDKCKFLTKLYEKLLLIILNKGTVKETYRVLFEALINAFESPPEKEDFEIVKSLGTGYKSKSYQMNVFSHVCAETGYPVRPGDRLGFVIVKTPWTIPKQLADGGIKPANLGLRMRLTEAWAATLPIEPIDVMYYLEHMVRAPLDQLMSTAFGKMLREKKVNETLFFKARSCDKPTTCDTPNKFVFAVIKQLEAARKRAAQKDESQTALSSADVAKAIRQIWKRIQSTFDTYGVV